MLTASRPLILLAALFLGACVANSKTGSAPDSGTRHSTTGAQQAYGEDPAAYGATQISVLPDANDPTTLTMRPTGPWKVTLLDGGAAIEFLGEVTEESMAALASELDAHPQTKVVHLTSPGGQLTPAKEVAEKIQARRITTYVPLQCMSACTLLFLAGDQRELAENAALGFHRSAMAGAGSGSIYELSGNESMRKLLIELGVTPAFAAKVLDTPHVEMWFPSPSELQAANAVTAVVSPKQHATSSLGSDPALLVDWSFLSDVVFNAFRQAYPTDYAKLREQIYEDIVKRGHNDGRLGLIASSALSPANKKALAETSLTALRGYYDAIGDLAIFLERQSAGACADSNDAMARLRGQNANIAYSLTNRVTLATVAVFNDVGKSKVQTPSQNQFDRAMKDLVSILVRQQTLTDSDRRAFSSGVSDQRRCKVLTAVLAAIANTRGEDAEILLRGFALFVDS